MPAPPRMPQRIPPPPPQRIAWENIPRVDREPVFAAPKPPAEPKEKTIFPIYFALVTDGPLPGEHNLLHISARFSEELKWSRNILPQTGQVRSGARLTEDLIQSLRKDAIPVTASMRQLSEWLERFKGPRLPVTSALGFWHLLFHMHKLTDKMPFISNPIDVNSFFAGSQGDLTKGRVVKGKEPGSVMDQRIAIVKAAMDAAGGIKW